MQAIIFSFMIPVVPLLLRRLYKKEEKSTPGALAARYTVYLLAVTVLSTGAMVALCDEGTSFWEKVDRSPVFALKYMVVALAAALAVAAAEWLYETRMVAFQVDRESFARHPGSWVLRRIVLPSCIYALAIVVAALNISMMFDNVLWGDEAYTGNLMRHTIPDILEITALDDSHPPLYYLWLKLWTQLLGRRGEVYHFVSLIPFFTGLVLALTIVRRRFGKIPAAFYIVLAGMAAPSLEYNVEVRMYGLAMFAVMFAYYSAYVILRDNKLTGWIFLVVCALIGAYSHYYGLLIVSILMVLTYLAACIRYGKRTWVKAAVSLLAFGAGYFPWLRILLGAMKRVQGNWWATTQPSLKECMTLIMGGDNMAGVVLPFFVLLLLALLIAESAVLCWRKKEDKLLIELKAPRAKGWSRDLDALAVGFLTIAGTFTAAYLACYLIRPVLARRYIYPLMGIVMMMLVIASSHLLTLLKQMGDGRNGRRAVMAGKAALLLVLAVLFTRGISDFTAANAEYKLQKSKTEEVLGLIGEQRDSMVLVNNGITHIGWTVLSYYYPEAEILNTSYDNVEADDYWYFTSSFMNEEQLNELIQEGYLLEGFGEKQLVKYPFVLYHFYKPQ